jgi:uncharacterized protein (TIGR02265 family)
MFAPLDTEERLAHAPRDRTVKGMVLESIAEVVVESCGRAEARIGPYMAFADYPIHELLELLPRAASLAFPHMPQRKAMCFMGRRAFFAIRRSMAGKALFAIAGRRFESALPLVTRAYSMVSGANVRLAHSGPNEAVVELRDIWAYPDCYHPGLFEAALDDYETQGLVLVRRLSLCDVDVGIQWTPRSRPPAI